MIKLNMEGEILLRDYMEMVVAATIRRFGKICRYNETFTVDAF